MFLELLLVNRIVPLLRQTYAKLMQTEKKVFAFRTAQIFISGAEIMLRNADNLGNLVGSFLMKHRCGTNILKL